MQKIEKYADCHVHIGGDTEKGYAMLDSLAEIGITEASLLSIALSSPDANLSALDYKKKYKKINLHVFGGLCYEGDYGRIPYHKQVETMLGQGCEGVKLIEMKPNCRKLVGKGLNDPSYDEMFSMLEERGIPVLAHVNDPETFWDKSQMTPAEIERGWWYGDGTFLTKQAIYDEVFEMLDRHPKL